MMRWLAPMALLVGGATVALSADTATMRRREADEDRAGLAKALAGLTAGKPQACLHTYPQYESLRFGDTILYRRSRNEVYRTETGGGCFGLRRGDAITTRTPSDSLCRGDIIETVDLVSHTPSGSCAFGDFTPYRKP